MWACLVHALQCLCDGHTCCPALPKQLVICHVLVNSTCRFTGLVHDGLNVAQNGNCANVYANVAVVHGHVWFMLCSVCAMGASDEMNSVPIFGTTISNLISFL